MKKVFIFLMLALFAFDVNAQNAWINELHYDNDGGDAGEFVEIVIENAGIYTLSDFQLNLYNGSSTSGASYFSETVNNFTIGSTLGNYTFYYLLTPGIQNGAPDGLALSYQGTLISGQFLSYEGSFDATDGPASGITSTDIGVSEPSTTPVGESLQLSGTGTSYTDFSWQAPATATIGDINTGQSFGGAPSNDQTSTVTVPVTQLVAGTISSIGTDSVPVIRFDITDAASGDGFSTNVTGVYFVAGPDNTLPFDEYLNGGGVYDLTNGAVIPVFFPAIVITANSVFLPVTLSVPDGGTVSVEAYIYIDNNNAPDNGVFQFRINAASHGFTAAASGSDFEATFAGGDIVGNDFTVDVVATQFTFLTQPSDVVVNQNMSNVVVGTTDAGGNIDIDYPDTFIQLSFSGIGNMFGASGNTAINGIANYPDLNFDTPETAVHLIASGGSFANVNSTDFSVLSGGGGATCGEALSVDVGTHHAIHSTTYDYDQWYVYHATADGTITAENCSSGYAGDTYLEIIEGSCSGTNFDQADDICGSLETLTLDVTAGNDYYIGWGDYDTGTPGEYDWTLSFTVSVNIVDAYAVSNDSLVVHYESSLTSVNPADYTLTGTGQTTVNFTAASIDATYDSIVYLKAQNNFAVNTIRDNLNDAANSTTYQFYAGVLPISYLNTANDPDTVRQGYNVTLNGVVTANDNWNQVWIQDSENPMSGVLIYSYSFDALVSVGDNITIVGQKLLYYGATEIVNPVLINSAGGGTPVAADINSADIDYYALADDANAEPWEGQLVTVTGIVIDSLNTSDYEYFGHTCDGTVICFDDDVDYHYGSGFALTNGNMYNITGVVTYFYGNYKINPRGVTDATEIVRDMTSVVEDPDTQVPDAIIDGTLAIDSLNAIEVFKFKVTDEGTDGLPTKLSQINVYTGPNNTIDLSGNVIYSGWFDFGDAVNPIVITEEPVFTANQITFPVDPESAMIGNGTSREVILHIWFDPAYLVDESVLQVMVQADPHGFIADCMNSQFAPTFASDIVGGSLTLDTNIGIENINQNSIRVYPNPAKNILFIKSSDEIQNITIVNVLGKDIFTKNINSSAAEINIADLNSGIYFIQIKKDNENIIIKSFVKE